MFKLAICIPTYNRAKHLDNCLQSIISIKQFSNLQFQVCVSDNGSTDNTEEIVKKAQEKIEIKYNKNDTNIGIPLNFLKVIEMAESEFTWLIGDDDLLFPNTIDSLYELIDKNPDVDFFYINSAHLTTEYVFSFPQPFDVKNLPTEMKTFSNYKNDGQIDFFDLINPSISFDFLGGMYLSVFRKSLWDDNINVLDKDKINDLRTFSSFDNTFPHVKIFSKAFANSKAYFYSKPLSISLYGAREWSPMYPFVHSFRIVEILEEHRKNGLPFLKYYNCRNYALNNFASDLGAMIIYRNTGLRYLNIYSGIFKNLIYPNTYISLFTFIGRKSIIILKRIAKKFEINKIII